MSKKQISTKERIIKAIAAIAKNTATLNYQDLQNLIRLVSRLINGFHTNDIPVEVIKEYKELKEYAFRRIKRINDDIASEVRDRYQNYPRTSQFMIEASEYGKSLLRAQSTPTVNVDEDLLGV